MYTNLSEQMAVHKLTDDDMGQIIGVSGSVFRRKLRTGQFFSDECKMFCSYFKKPFSYLFAASDEQPALSGAEAVS